MKNPLLALAVSLLALVSLHDTEVADLRCEFRKDPLAIDAPKPGLSWKISSDSDERGVKQTAYQILATACLMTTRLFAADSTPAAPDFAAMRAEVEALANLTEVPKYEVVERADATPNLKPILYSGLDYQGKPTKVFDWLGVPENTTGNVPGVVLVHSCGGSASKGWVESWNKQGYAAISKSLEGHNDKKAKLPEGGPERPGIFGDSIALIKDQWMYHAVADATLAAAILRSLPEVDSSKIGINGCSWGGIITSTVIGIDPRYAFAISVYGCSGLDKVPNHYGGSLSNNDVYKKVWDANLRLDRARMPILWHSWLQDAHFSMEAFENANHWPIASRCSYSFSAWGMEICRIAPSGSRLRPAS